MSSSDSTIPQFLATLKQLYCRTLFHTDALQLYVSQLRAVPRAQRLHLQRMESLQRQLDDAVEAAKRVATLSTALQKARTTARALHGAAVAPSSITATTSLSDILHFAKEAEAFDGESDATSSIVTAIGNCEANVARLQEAIRQEGQQSLRVKVGELERLRRKLAEMGPPEDLLLSAFATFRYSDAMEALFLAEVEEEGDAAEDGADGMDSDDGSPKSPSSSSSSISGEELSQMIQSAAHRLALRLQDAFSALQLYTENNEDEIHLFLEESRRGGGDWRDQQVRQQRRRSTSSSSPRGHCGLTAEQYQRLQQAATFCMALSSRRSDAPVRIADALQRLSEADLAEEFASLDEQWTATAATRQRPSSSSPSVDAPAPSSDGDTLATSTMITLPEEPWVILPPHWSTAQLLHVPSMIVTKDGVPDGCGDVPAVLLPPASRDLHPRFTAGSRDELERLERARVDLQRHIIFQHVLNIPAEWRCSSSSEHEEDLEESDVAERLNKYRLTRAMAHLNEEGCGPQWTVFGKAQE